MKFRALQVLALGAAAPTWIACGAGHPKIVHLAVSPAMAAATINLSPDVQFTATATFDNNTNRELTIADGLTWSSSNSSMATITDNGSATCIAVGPPITITAQAPTEPDLTMNNGVNNTSPKITGTAQLSCVEVVPL